MCLWGEYVLICNFKKDGSDWLLWHTAAWLHSPSGFSPWVFPICICHEVPVSLEIGFSTSSCSRLSTSWNLMGLSSLLKNIWTLRTPLRSILVSSFCSIGGLKGTIDVAALVSTELLSATSMSIVWFFRGFSGAFCTYITLKHN